MIVEKSAVRHCAEEFLWNNPTMSVIHIGALRKASESLAKFLEPAGNRKAEVRGRQECLRTQVIRREAVNLSKSINVKHSRAQCVLFDLSELGFGVYLRRILNLKKESSLPVPEMSAGIQVRGTRIVKECRRRKE